MDNDSRFLAEACYKKALSSVLPALQTLSRLTALREDTAQQTVFTGVLELLLEDGDTIRAHAVALTKARRYFLTSFLPSFLTYFLTYLLALTQARRYDEALRRFSRLAEAPGAR